MAFCIKKPLPATNAGIIAADPRQLNAAVAVIEILTLETAQHLAEAYQAGKSLSSQLCTIQFEKQ